MAARFKTITYTLPSTAAVSLETILNSTGDTYVSSLVVRTKADNTADITWEDSGGSVGGYLQAGEAVSIDLTNKFVKTSEIFFKGAASNILYITVVG